MRKALQCFKNDSLLAIKNVFEEGFTNVPIKFMKMCF